MKINEDFTLGFEEEAYFAGYWTARIAPDIGVSVCYSTTFTTITVQLFPWVPSSDARGHAMYSNLIVNTAKSADSDFLRRRFPGFMTDVSDALTLKACILDALDRRTKDGA